MSKPSRVLTIALGILLSSPVIAQIAYLDMTKLIDVYGLWQDRLSPVFITHSWPDTCFNSESNQVVLAARLAAGERLLALRPSAFSG